MEISTDASALRKDRVGGTGGGGSILLWKRGVAHESYIRVFRQARRHGLNMARVRMICGYKRTKASLIFLERAAVRKS